MASAVFSDPAKAALLRFLFDANQQPTLRLFVNNITVDEGTTLADLTEASFAGYQAKDLSETNDPIVEPAASAYYEWSQNTFTTTADQTPTVLAYGWYITYYTGGAMQLLFCANFGTPQSFRLAGDQLSFDLVVEDQELDF